MLELLYIYPIVEFLALLDADQLTVDGLFDADRHSPRRQTES